MQNEFQHLQKLKDVYTDMYALSINSKSAYL